MWEPLMATRWTEGDADGSPLDPRHSPGSRSLSPETIGMKRFAWDGFAFDVPEDWNLSSYDFGRHTSGVRMEDDDALRLQFDWVRPSSRIRLDKVQARYAKQSARLTTVADQAIACDDLEAGWTAFVYHLPDRHYLVVAYWVAPDLSFFGFLRLHFGSVGPKKPERLLRHVASSFQLSGSGPAPWLFYDVAFALTPDFRLVDTAFQAGSKAMTFQRRLRILSIWQFSMADTILAGRSPAAFAVDFLDQHRPLRGPQFRAIAPDQMTSERTTSFPLARYDEIGRWCFRYAAQCVHLSAVNALFLWVYNFRTPRDLEALQRDFVPPTNGLAP